MIPWTKIYIKAMKKYCNPNSLHPDNALSVLEVLYNLSKPTNSAQLNALYSLQGSNKTHNNIKTKGNATYKIIMDWESLFAGKENEFILYYLEETIKN